MKGFQMDIRAGLEARSEGQELIAPLAQNRDILQGVEARAEGQPIAPLAPAADVELDPVEAAARVELNRELDVRRGLIFALNREVDARGARIAELNREVSLRNKMLETDRFYSRLLFGLTTPLVVWAVSCSSLSKLSSSSLCLLAVSSLSFGLFVNRLIGQCDKIFRINIFFRGCPR